MCKGTKCRCWNSYMHYIHSRNVQISDHSGRRWVLSPRDESILEWNVHLNLRKKRNTVHLVKLLAYLVGECYCPIPTWSVSLKYIQGQNNLYSWRHTLWSNETKTKGFGIKDHNCFWRKRVKPASLREQSQLCILKGGWEFCCKRDWCTK